MSALAFTHARVIDGRGGLLDGATVVVRDGRIASVGPDRRVTVPRGAVRVNARGLTLLPGLIDCHVHLCLGADADVDRVLREETSGRTLLKAAAFARETLAAGFTTVRDLGYRNHDIFELARAVDAGRLPGPRIVAAGLAICMTGGHANWIGRQADGPDEIVNAVREQLAAGARVVKFIASGGVLTPGTSPDQPQLTVEELSAGMREARQAGRTVAAHAHAAAGMINASLAGTHSIEHGTLMDEEAAAVMRDRGVYMVPTLSALATTAEGGTSCGIPASAVEKASAMRIRHQASFRKAMATGVPIAMGTDAGTPFNRHGENAQELERMVALGMRPMEALVATTSAAARLLGLGQEIGTIEKGKMADLVILKGNPLGKISLVRDQKRIMGVMQAGRFVSGPLREG
jgi:imidazolonepropionase-like amidohydrolase